MLNSKHKYFPSIKRQAMQYKKYRGIKQALRPSFYGPNFYLLLTN